MLKNNIGVVGLAVMGSNLALNIERNNYTVSVFNRSSEKTNQLMKKSIGKRIYPYFSIKEFVNSLKKPRCILIMVKSGLPTDKTIESIIPYLNTGDILIDGGNSFYKDTIRRCSELSRIGLIFFGAGISGGEEGALNGPSIMLGGQKKSYNLISPIFKKIAAKTNDQESCVDYIGPDGAGHYVKMVHNGIEYSDMQLISETYFLLKNMLLMSNEELANTFDNWNEGELNSYLISITKEIFKKKDSSGKYLIDFILDYADNKGTGKWTSKSALDLDEPLSLITESVFSRYLSALKEQRVYASKILSGPEMDKLSFNKKDFIEKIRKALYLGKIISYAQGFSQLKAASEKYKWNLSYGKIAKIFRAGCIIRAKFLQKITDAYAEKNDIVNLLLTPYFRNIANEYQNALRSVVSYAVIYGMPIPTFSAAIAYYDSYRTAVLPANLLQAQRDYFGAHMYRRIDKDGIFHTNWLE
ncbi:NADP-dependent phosphogluconate dehydrogenase [Buchnera aphidicola (Pemphigus obesinymphae)]|uniref:NADP-dependent phosphogluconate dehydrogenase n=1 Tax=Buchnera aphidicola TaxID=9 RepID=UPI0022388E10|nr:NADP-dependent phosphogluconate dehydrogenase [Buchnera aphidicola]MCW5196809.1 NADP-dependent phosphogluconate dehydrogenase [Buchnera aphidicola (Pemphigus obesinymphae)]